VVNGGISRIPGVARGFRSVTEAAQVSVHLATLPVDGPTGTFWGHLWTADGPADAYGTLPW